MKRLENLIDMARKLSQNQRYDADSGVSQDVFVQYFNNGQDALIKEVMNLKTKYFKKSVTVPVVSGQEAYDYPFDCYVQHLDTIQWSDTNTGAYFQTLKRGYVKEKITTQVSYPFSYVPYETNFHLQPPIGNGTLYITYMRTVDRLQKRAGQITVATISSGQLTALEVDDAQSDYDQAEINSDYYLCVVDKYGAIKARNVPYDSVSAGVFTLDPFTLAATDSIAVGDYICVGKNSVNLPTWPDICESYLLKHAVYEAKYGDASQWSQEALQDMQRCFAGLSDTFATNSDDLIEIMISNTDYLAMY